MTSNTTISTANTMALASVVEMYALASASMMPRSSPPRNAPGMEPMPPNTAAVNALMPGMEPVVGMSDVLNEQSSTPAMAASAEPMAKVAEMVALTLMPMSCAAALSSEQARMALPILLLLTKVVNASMMTTQTAMVRSEM